MKHFLIETPARIHLGFLELDPNANRNFGSIGLTISNFKTIISLKESKKLIINSRDEDKIEKIIKKLTKIYRFPKFEISILKSIPMHTGLGSGTQLALSLGMILSKFFNKNISTEELSLNLGRGKRSGIGIESFNNGGFIVDGGRTKNSKKTPPILFNCKWPKEWKIILIFDHELKGIHGDKEKEEFKKIIKVSDNFSKENCKSLTMKILPSLIEKNFDEFCSGVQEIQNNTALVFSKAQGGLFTSKKIEKIFTNLKKIKGISFGQSSWGPTGFVICRNSSHRKDILSYINKFVKKIYIDKIDMLNVEGRNQGFKLTKIGIE